MITLPTTPIKPVSNDPKTLLLYGPPKHGKTSILANLPNNLIIDLEDGSDHVSALKIKCADVNEFTQVCDLLIKQNRPYKYVTIDTIDRLEDWAETEATKMYRNSVQGKNYPAGVSVLNLPNGGGYLWLRQAFNKFMARVFTLAPHVILVGHIRDKMIESAGKEVSAKDLDLTGKIKSIICSKVDAIGYFCRSPKNPNIMRITFESSDTINCGSRCEHLRGMSFEFEGREDKFDWEKIFTTLKTPSKVEAEKSPVGIEEVKIEN